MARSAAYSPVFRGKFPTDSRTRWAAIHRFLDEWCGIDGVVLDAPGSQLVEAARRRTDHRLSYSIERWLELAERAGVTGVPNIRDCPVVGPIEDRFLGEAVTDATVILASGESDVFWAVANSELGDDDPPVEVYQKYDRLSPPLLGRVGSVSEFALKYLCLYNEHAPRCAEWFSADGTEEEIRTARDWFDQALIFDSNDGWCGPLWLFERDGAAAIVRGERVEVSVFGDPAAMGMPPFLEGAMKEHQALRRQFKSS